MYYLISRIPNQIRHTNQAQQNILRYPAKKKYIKKKQNILEVTCGPVATNLNNTYALSIAKVYLFLFIVVFSGTFAFIYNTKNLEEHHKSTSRSWHSYKVTYVYCVIL